MSVYWIGWKAAFYPEWTDFFHLCRELRALFIGPIEITW